MGIFITPSIDPRPHHDSEVQFASENPGAGTAPGTDLPWHNMDCDRDY